MEETKFKINDIEHTVDISGSPHLIHGLSINYEKDKTRVALEFRLFKK